MGISDTKTVSYSSLVKKYENFMVPAMVMKIDNKDVSRMSGIYIAQVDVQLSIDSICSASFTLENVYKLQESSFFSNIKSNFQLGSIVSIELGYGSSTEPVFWGYIHELQYSFDEVASISVNALDMRRLMRMNQENRTFSDKSYSEIFKEVIGKYSKVYQSTKVDTMTDKIERLAQNVNDYDFVLKELCKKANKEFYVLAGKVYFQDKNESKIPLITLKWGENLFSFHVNRRYCNEEIAVYGVDGKDVVISKEQVVSDGKMKKLTAKPLRRDIKGSNVDDKKGTQALARKEAQKRKRNAKDGSGSCIGIPELMPGRYIAIENLDVDGSDFKGYVTRVSHSFSESGFTTNFEFGG